MRKTTFEQRMKSYIIMLILTGAFLTLSTGFMWLKNNQPTTPTQDVVYLEYMDGVVEHVEPLKLISMSDNETQEVELEELVEYDSNGFDGDIVIATAREVITMQTIDGVKTFTNHLIG